MNDGVLGKCSPVVVLIQLGDAFHAEIIDPSGSQDTKYAFYLVRDGKRVAIREYRKNGREAVFQGPHPNGTYRVTGFCFDGAEDAKRISYSDSLCISRAAKSAIIPQPEFVASVKRFTDRLNAGDVQRFDIKIGSMTYNLLKGVFREGRLYVMLGGAVGNRDQVQLPRFNRFSWQDLFPGTLVCIADPTLYLDNKLQLGWYIGTPEHNVAHNIVRIVNAICKKLSLKKEDVVFYGSSGGGYAALQCCAYMGGGATAIAINPQVKIVNYKVDVVNAFLTSCFHGISKNEAVCLYEKRFSAIEAWQENSASMSRCLIVQNIQDRFHYNKHYREFASAFGIPDNGKTADGRMGSFVYDHPSGHDAEPKLMVQSILNSAFELRWPGGAKS